MSRHSPYRTTNGLTSITPDTMNLAGVVRGRRVITQPVEDRVTLAGYSAATMNPVTGIENEGTDISIRRGVSAEDQNGATGMVDSTAATSTSVSMDDENVVDIQQTRGLQNCIIAREQGLLAKDFKINVRHGDHSSCNAVDEQVQADLQVLEEPEDCMLSQKKGPVSYGEHCDVVQLLNEIPTYRGVFLNQQVLHCENGKYIEGMHYRLVPDTYSKGAFGEAAMCEDITTKKTFMRKTVRKKLSRNEIEVPLMLRGNVGIAEVYGVSIQDEVTEIFQEFAGLSLKNLIETRSEYTRQLCDPKMVMVLAFQAFATLQKMHSQNITHQDIKPENLCVNIQTNGSWLLKFIDFGSSQTLHDRVIEGLTNEYLSPESCNLILEIATEKRLKDSGRLGPGLDVWSMALSLLYCLCGYHVMVYVCTGQTKYLEQDPVKLQFLRMQCLLKIRALKDEDILRKLIHPDWPDALKTLLVNTLRVDPNTRWTAKTAAEFILHHWILKGVVTQMQPMSAVAQTVPPAAQPLVSTTAALPAAAAGITFRGLNPARLVFQTQISYTQDTERTIEMQTAAQRTREMHAVAQRSTEIQPVQCSSPTSVGSPCSPCTMSSVMDLPSPSQLPDFTDLLSSGTAAKKPQRRTRGKQRLEPYHQSARKGSKNM